MQVLQIIQSLVLFVVYFTLGLIAVFQLIGAIAATSMAETVLRMAVVLAIGLFFAIKIQRRFRRKDN